MVQLLVSLQHRTSAEHSSTLPARRRVPRRQVARCRGGERRRLPLAGGPRSAGSYWPGLEPARPTQRRACWDSSVAHLLAELGEEVVLQVDELELGGEQHGVAFFLNLPLENFTWNSVKE